jgi:hypothetical protein
LYFLFPEIIDRTCEKCEKYQYHDTIEKMGELIVLESGEPMKRPVGCQAPCYMCPKIPKSVKEKTRASAIEPTERSLTAIEHYQQCEAVRRFPEDEIVERNAGIISDAVKRADVANSREDATMLALMLLSGAKRV